MTSFNRFVTNFVKAQLVVTLVSLPFLVSWGLPLSIMSVVGNLLFSPLLTLYLLISSLIFFTEMLLIPNGALIWCLHTLQTIWLYLLTSGTKLWLISFAKPPLLLLVLVPLGGFVILRSKRFRSAQHHVAALGLFCFSTFALLALQPEKHAHQAVSGMADETKLICQRDGSGQLHLVDAGYFDTKADIAKRVSFKLKPYLIAQYGTTHIDSITLNEPCAGSFNAVVEMTKTFSIEKVFLPYFDKKLSKYEWFCFFQMKRVLKDEGIELRRKQTNQTNIG